MSVTWRLAPEPISTIPRTSSKWSASGWPLVIGTLYGNGVPIAGTKWKGYIDEVRVISGTAKYTAGFTPAGPFTL